MLVFYKERLVFLAVPKTGTTAYEQALAAHASIVVSDPPQLKHAPLRRYDRFFRPMFEKLFEVEMDTLAVIRHPVSWLGSWYRYRRRPFMAGNPNATLDVSFDEFVLAYLKGDPPEFANVGSQAKFLEQRPTGARVTHLFRYEEPDRLNRFLEQRLNLKLDLSRVNVSPKMDLQLSPKTEQKLRSKCPQEFALYDGIA